MGMASPKKSLLTSIILFARVSWVMGVATIFYNSTTSPKNAKTSSCFWVTATIALPVTTRSLDHSCNRRVKLFTATIILPVTTRSLDHSYDRRVKLFLFVRSKHNLSTAHLMSFLSPWMNFVLLARSLGTMNCTNHANSLNWAKHSATVIFPWWKFINSRTFTDILDSPRYFFYEILQRNEPMLFCQRSPSLIQPPTNIFNPSPPDLPHNQPFWRHKASRSWR